MSTFRIQAVLNNQYQREKEAIEECDYLMAHLPNSHSKMRDAIVEAFIAAHMMREKGWQPSAPYTQATLTAEVAEMMHKTSGMIGVLEALAARLANLTISVSNGTVTPEEQIEIADIQNKLSGFQKGSMKILGTAISFDEEE